MNPLTRALKLAEDPRLRIGGRPSRTAVEAHEGLASIRATGDKPDSDVLSPASLAFGDARGPETPHAAQPAPLRVTRDEPDPETLPPATLASGDARGPEAPHATRLAPLRVTRDEPDPETLPPAPPASGDGRGPEAPHATRLAPLRVTRDIPDPEPTPATLGGAPSDPADAAENDAGATRTDERDRFRSLPGRRRAGRSIGVALSMLAAAGAAAGGGTLLWKAELARPALIGSLPPLPEVAMEPNPVHAGNAAGHESRKPARSAAPPTEAPPDIFAAAPGSGDPPALPAAVPGHTGESASPTGPGDGGHPAGSTAVSATALTESASSGLPVPGAPGETRGAPAGHGAPAAERDEANPRPGSRIAIRKRTRADHVAQSLGRAYGAYLAGDGEAAGQIYRTVLGHEPRNRDARLGLAAVAARAGRWAEAAEHYATLLASHPADTTARAALIAIAEKDPARAESRLKSLLRMEPEAAHLHFGLGNLYAAQSRWPEAQQSWFRAYRLDRGNADHAYNLAVGLDHLSQSRTALELYREALVLARSSPASFDAEAVRKRILAIESRPDAGGTPDSAHLEEAAAAAVEVR